MKQQLNEKHMLYLVYAFVAVYVAGLFVHVMNVDAALYAELAREMAKSGDWLHLHLSGNDYLDKPPLHFWLAALSFKIFGVHDWSYKLPSFLFFILAVHSVIRLGEMLYDRKTGLLAALFFVSVFCAMLMTNDVRTDTIMVGCLSFTTWQLLAFIRGSRMKNLVLGAAGIGLAMLTKGPMGLIFPVLAIGANQLYKRDLKFLLDFRLLLGLVVIALILLPMSIGLYQQFDLHPEKTVNGHTGVSGLRFFYWTQSFGRITGESDWGTKYNNGATPFFFTHTFLWSFAPWSLFVVGGLIADLVTLVKKRFRRDALPEVFSSAGFLLIFVALSASKYRLPHYLYVTFPFAALVAARFFREYVLENTRRLFAIITNTIHFIALLGITGVAWLIMFRFFPDAHVLPLVFLGGFIAAICLFVFTNQFIYRSVYSMCIALLFFYLVMETVFYPSLLKYDASTQAGLVYASKVHGEVPVRVFGDIADNSFDFYAQAQRPSDGRSLSDFLSGNYPEKKLYLYVDEDAYTEVKNAHATVAWKQEFSFYPVQFLSFPFLDPATRALRLKKRYLLLVTVP